MGRNKGKRKSTLASQADCHELYQLSVQEPECETKFFVRAYKNAYGKAPLILREDFCGTAAICAQWVRGGAERRAYGVDIEAAVLAWGERNNLSRLNDSARERVSLIQGDVRNASCPKADIVAAQNFSYFCFKTRDELRGYFEAARSALAAQGVMVLDIMGGAETLEEDRVETTEQDGFDYIWELERFDPISHHCRYAIHFEFPDGSKRKRALVYDWRMWSIPEVRELIEEAGFSSSEVYWEGTDSSTGEGNGVYTRRQQAEADPAWVAYIVAAK